MDQLEISIPPICACEREDGRKAKKEGVGLRVVTNSFPLFVSSFSLSLVSSVSVWGVCVRVPYFLLGKS